MKKVTKRRVQVEEEDTEFRCDICGVLLGDDDSHPQLRLSCSHDRNAYRGDDDREVLDVRMDVCRSCLDKAVPEDPGGWYGDVRSAPATLRLLAALLEKARP
jgi:hypothetical protein